ncbi:hypothetical protein N0V83_004310 [Neocucurbitaria cava]|uniref:Proline dehydrogenase n=1 Tax=Neocucurbitaria cava TaxID=798079 RepID=A0A9W9CP51_9PLEO|nr:hypothetical protein N0V83_004310 [Neocucurbitaria cava]
MTMAAFNISDSALVFNTYQMYLKSGFDTLKSHLQIAQARNFVSGIKLVRGAYIYVEPKRASIIHDNKVDCDNAYDAAVELLLRGKQFEGNEYPKPWTAEVMLATHNMNSVEKALNIYIQQDMSRTSITGTQKLVFAQLMGMADEITMKLASRLQAMGEKSGLGVYKYTVWGSLEDCLLYMLRRAEENQDAAARSRVTAVLMLKEIGTRLRFWRS